MDIPDRTLSGSSSLECVGLGIQECPFTYTFCHIVVDVSTLFLKIFS